MFIKLYTRFIISIRGETVRKRKYDMKHEYGCSNIHKLIDGRKKCIKGWILLEDEPLTEIEDVSDDM